MIKITEDLYIHPDHVTFVDREARGCRIAFDDGSAQYVDVPLEDVITALDNPA